MVRAMLQTHIEDYKEHLKERHNQMLAALDHFGAAVAEVVSTTKLREPKYMPRHRAGGGQDLALAAWHQEVTAARPLGATTVTLRVELTLGLGGLTCVVRDPRDVGAPVFFSRTYDNFQVSEDFLILATALAADPKVRTDKWEATLYTY